jgi:hypothetical protein
VLALLITKNLQFLWDPGGVKFPTERPRTDDMLYICVFFLELSVDKVSGGRNLLYHMEFPLQSQGFFQIAEANCK